MKGVDAHVCQLDITWAENVVERSACFDGFLFQCY